MVEILAGIVVLWLAFIVILGALSFMCDTTGNIERELETPEEKRRNERREQMIREGKPVGPICPKEKKKWFHFFTSTNR